MDTTYISPKTKIGENVFIGEFVKILGNSNIGAGTYLDDFVYVGYPHSYETRKFMEAYKLTKEIKLDDFINKKTNIGKNSEIMRGTIVGAGSKIGDNLFCSPGEFIGADNIIGNDVRVNYNAKIYNRVKIGDDCIIGGFICNDCEIGNSVNMLGNAVHKKNNPRQNRDSIANNQPSPKINDFANIVLGAILIGDITIGEGAEIGAGAIVTKDVNPYDVVVGINTPIKNKYLNDYLKFEEMISQ